MTCDVASTNFRYLLVVRVRFSYDENDFIRNTTADFILWEVFGRTGFTYNSSMGSVSRALGLAHSAAM